jgi:hypothetical protein
LLLGVVNSIVVCVATRFGVVDKRLTFAFAFPVGEMITFVAACVGCPVMP